MRNISNSNKCLLQEFLYFQVDPQVLGVQVWKQIWVLRKRYSVHGKNKDSMLCRVSSLRFSPLCYLLLFCFFLNVITVKYQNVHFIVHVQYSSILLVNFDKHFLPYIHKMLILRSQYVLFCRQSNDDEVLTSKVLCRKVICLSRPYYNIISVWDITGYFLLTTRFAEYVLAKP